MALFNALLPPSPRASTPRRRDQRALTTRKKKISLLRETSRFLIKGSRSIQQVVLFSTNVLVHFIRIHPVLRISLLSFFLPFFFHVYLSSFNLTCVNVIKILHTHIYIYSFYDIIRESSCDIVERVNEVEWKFPSNHEWYPINRIEDRLDPINRSKKRVRVLPRILPTRAVRRIRFVIQEPWRRGGR